MKRLDNKFIEVDKIDDHTDDTPEIKVHCWNCGKEFHIKSENFDAGRLFCSDKCRKENYEK